MSDNIETVEIIFANSVALNSVLDVRGQPNSLLLQRTDKGYKVFGGYKTEQESLLAAESLPVGVTYTVAVKPTDRITLIEHAAALLYFEDNVDVASCHTTEDMRHIPFTAKIENKGGTK